MTDSEKKLVGSTKLTDVTPDVPDDCKTDNERSANSDQNIDVPTSETSEELLDSLAKQLLYYLSTQNLSDDTYLKTIMELNSDHLPVSIVSNFSNITRIIKDSLVDGETISSCDVPGLVREAAFRSQFLEVAVLNQNGIIVSKVEDGNHQLETGRVTYFAIAPTSLRPTDHDTSTPLRRDNVQGLGEKAKNDTANIIILRDVHEDATEENIREVFHRTVNTSIDITDVQSEIGNCWFVTLGPMKRQQDMVDMLLSLRSMKICDKPIKARLKTQRMVVNKHSSPIESLVPSSSGYNPYRTWNRNKSAGGSFKGHSNQIYAGDRVYYSGKKNFEKGRGSGAPGGFSKSPRGIRGNNKSNSNGTLINKGMVEHIQNNKQESIVLPPPSCEKNFPSLGGNSPKSTIDAVDNKMTSEKKDLSGSVVVEQKSDTAVPIIISSKEPSTPTGGYAAALRKAVPNTDDIVAAVRSNSLPTLSVTKPLERKRLAQRHESVMNSMSSKSSGTASTDDASSDDKSSLSSKPESDRSLTVNAGSLSSSTIVTTPVTSVGWGGGRSFAEIVKKQETADINMTKN